MLFKRVATTAGQVPTVRGPTVLLPASGGVPPRPAPRQPRPGRVASDRSRAVRVQVLDLLTPWAVALATLIARLATTARGPTDWDSAQYAAAVTHFDVTHGRPQPPGYWLYVAAGRLVHATGVSTVASLVLVAAVASAAAAGLTVVAGRDLGGRWVGIAAGVVVATSPIVWFNGSIISTYSFDLLIAPLLIILAWRARPHSWHGAGALVALALAAGFRQSIASMFLPLALLAVVGSVRRVREGILAVVAALLALSAWLVPMLLAQPGGVEAWTRATRTESQGAVRATSVLDHASGGAVNLGTFAAYTTIAVLPLVALAALALLGLGGRALVGRLTPASRRTPPPSLADTPRATSRTDRRTGGPRHRRRPPPWNRPWYQSTAAVLIAAVVPPMAMVALVQFAKGGYALAYLPGLVIALLLAPAALLRGRGRPAGWGSRAWAVVATAVILGISVVGVDRFLTAGALLPVAANDGTTGLWLTQTRYQAPYPETRAAIRAADAVTAQLARLGPLVDPATDVVVVDSVDGGTAFFRQAGWALPSTRISLISPGSVDYTEQGGSLFYPDAATIPVAPGGAVYLIAAPTLPGLRALAGTGDVRRMTGFRVADYLVWRIEPGAPVLGVQVVATPGPRPPGPGING